MVRGSWLIFGVAVLVLSALALVDEGRADVLYWTDCSASNWSFSAGGGGGVGVDGGRCYVQCGTSGEGANGWTDDPHVNLSTSGVVMVDFVNWNHSANVHTSWYSMTDVDHAPYNAADNIIGFNFGTGAGDLFSNGYNAGDENDTTFDMNANQLYNITLTYDYSNGIYNISVDGDVKGSANYAHNAPAPAWIDAISVQWAAYNEGTVAWDSICIRNGSTEFNCSSPSPPASSPSVVFNPGPANNTHFRISPVVNYSISNYNADGNENKSRTCDVSTRPNDGYYIKVCVNVTYAGSWSCGIESEERYFVYDNESPEIVWTWPSYPSGTTSTADSDELNISVSDLYLNEVEVNVSCGGETKFYNKTTGLTDNINFTQEVSWGELDGVVCYVNVSASDDHTAFSIPVYEYDALRDKVEFGTDLGHLIMVESVGVLSDNTEVTRLADRYKWEFKYADFGSVFSYRVTNNYPLTYNDRREYPAFTTSPSDRLEGHWIDFNTEGLDRWEVERVSDYEYLVTVWLEKPMRNVEFKSVGGLNVISQVSNLTVDNVHPSWNDLFPPDNWNNPLLGQLHYFNVTESNPSIAYLWSNNSGSWVRSYNWTGWSSGDNLSVEFNSSDLGDRLWAVELVDSFGNTNMTGNFSIIPYFNKTVNFTFYSEVTGLLIDDENITLTGIGVFGSFALNTSNGSIVYDLRSPANWTLEYSSPGRSQRSYEFNATGSEFETLILYLGNNTQDVVITVIDEFDELVEGAIIRVYRFDGASYVLVDTVTTDFQGQALTDVTLDTELYYFEVSYDGSVVRTTDPAYVIDTTLVIVVTLGSTEETQQGTGKGIGYSMVPVGVLGNGSIYEFGFNVTSSYWSLTSCSLSLYGGDVLVQSGNVTLASDSCVSTLVYNTSDYTNYTLVGSFVENGTFTVNHSRFYQVRDVSEGEFSLKNFLDDITSFGSAGFNDFTRALIALIVIFALVVVVSATAGLNNPDGVIVVVLAGVLFFSYVGWLYLGFVPDIGHLRQYLVMYLSSLLGLGLILWRRT